MRFKFIMVCFIAVALLNVKGFAQQQTIIDSTTAKTILNNCAAKFPKFYREFNYSKVHDTLIRKFIFVKYPDGVDNGPAKAGPKGNIFIDIKYLESEQPNFDDNRLIVVLYHEIGHLHYFMTTPPTKRDIMENEKFAFEYSLLKTKELAANGDYMPLKTGLKFMKLRSESNNLQDPHVRALKLMVTEPLYAQYLVYIKGK